MPLIWLVVPASTWASRQHYLTNCPRRLCGGSVTRMHARRRSREGSRICARYVEWNIRNGVEESLHPFARTKEAMSPLGRNQTAGAPMTRRPLFTQLRRLGPSAGASRCATTGLMHAKQWHGHTYACSAGASGWLKAEIRTPFSSNNMLWTDSDIARKARYISERRPRADLCCLLVPWPAVPRPDKILSTKPYVATVYSENVQQSQQKVKDRMVSYPT